MNQEQNARFTEFLRSKAAEAETDTGYRPTFLLRMLNEKGGYQTALTLLSAHNPSEGFTRLWKLQRLDLSIEALVVESEWRTFFPAELLAKSERLLQGSRYSFRRYQANLAQVQPADESVMLPKKRKNSISFSELCERLGTPLVNPLDRWCGLSTDHRRAVFSLWSDELTAGRYVFWDDEKSGNDVRIGARELHTTLHQVISNGYEAYGILCEADNPSSPERKRGYFQEDIVLILRLVKESPGIVAYVQGEVSTSAVMEGMGAFGRPFYPAADDLHMPQGVAQPDRFTTLRTSYRRDDSVRQFVLSRAKGRCEYCGEQGFELPDGRHYLEAHHIISMSNDGPDRIDNVIALCAHHHREAHYGKDSEQLEKAFTEKLIQLLGDNNK